MAGLALGPGCDILSGKRHWTISPMLGLGKNFPILLEKGLSLHKLASRFASCLTNLQQLFCRERRILLLARVCRGGSGSSKDLVSKPGKRIVRRLSLIETKLLSHHRERAPAYRPNRVFFEG